MVNFCGVLLKPGRSAETARRIVKGMLAEHDRPGFECHDRKIDDHLWVGFAEPRVFAHERKRRGLITVRDGLACFGDVALYNRHRLNQPDTREDDVTALHRWLRRDGDLGVVNGDFSAGTYDLEARKLTLFRDQVGVGSILHTQHPDGFVFANNARFLPGAGIPGLDLDPVTLAAFVALQFDCVHRHYLTGVHEMPLAHRISAKPGTDPVTEQYWDVTETDGHGYKGQDCIEHIRELFVRAVAARIEGANRPGICLSGGLDSSSVAGVVAHLRAEQEIFGFAHMPGAAMDHDARADDRPFVNIIEKHWPNLTVTPVTSNHKDVFHGSEFWAEHKFSPCHDAGFFASSSLHDSAVASGVDVLLDGYAGDDTLSCWGDHVFYEALLSGKVRLAAQELQRLFRDKRRTLRNHVLTSLVRPLVPQFIIAARARRRGSHWTQTSSLYPKWFDDPELHQLLVAGELDAMTPNFTRMRDNIAGAVGVSNSTGYNHRQFYLGERGLRQRSPMQDRDLITALYWTPVELFVSAKRDRELIRSVCAPFLPEEILARSSKAAFVQDMNARLEQTIASTPELLEKPDNVVWSDVVSYSQWVNEIEKRRHLIVPPFWDIFVMMYPAIFASRFAENTNQVLAAARARQRP